MRRRLSFALLLAVACGGDSSTGPSAPNVTGSWSYNVSNIAGPDVSCNVAGSSLTLAQTGSNFTGTASGGSITCFGPSGSFNDNLDNDVVINGVVSGNNVAFDIGTTDAHNAGTISGGSMNGTLTLRITAGTTTVVLTGSFSAVRQ
jgi:hypothetical protein